MNQSIRRPPRALRLLAGLIAAVAVAAPASGAPGHRRGNVSEKVLAEVKQKERQKRGQAKLDVLVRFRSRPAAAERALLATLGGRVRRLHESGWISVQVPAHAVDALARHKAVGYIASDPVIWAAMDVARATAGRPGLELPESWLKGSGVTIAMVDSGVAQHAEIQTLTAAVDYVQPWVTSTDPATTVDPNGHGTHVAAILVGDGGHSKDKRLSGIAPEARLISLRVLDAAGSGRASDMLAALDWVRANKDAYGIRVLNLSLGHPVYEPAIQDPLVQAVEALWDAGVVVVCSAGNLGRDGHGTITSPCNARKVISVGALNDRNTLDLTDDTVATYSSRGPTAIDGVAKPDLVAPGNRIVSGRSAGSQLDLSYPERRVADDPLAPEVQEHFELSGTSMAAPMVAGAAALMIQQEPWLTPATVKARLMLSARKSAAGDPFATGAGALDILAALRTTETAFAAPSPRVWAASSDTLVVEDTAVLWSNPAFSIQALWSAGVLWSTEPAGDGLVASYGLMCTDTSTSTSATLWSEASLWPEATLWPESTLWSESVLFSDDPVAVSVGSLSTPRADP